MKDYNTWLHHVKVKLCYFGLMKWDKELCPKSWKMYYDEGLTPSQAITEDMGKIDLFSVKFVPKPS